MTEMARKYEELLVNLVNEDPDYVVDVLGISSWELVNKFPVKVKRFIEEEYNVRPENAGVLSTYEEDGDDFGVPEEGWPDDEEEV